MPSSSGLARSTPRQSNNNAAQYHFGSRVRLIEAVLDRRMARIDQRRAQMIAALDPDAPLEDLERAVVVPFAEVGRRHRRYVAFFAQLRSSRRHSGLVTHARPRTSSFLDVRDRIDARIDELPPEERSRRHWLCGSLIVHAVAEFVAAPAEQPYDTWDELVDGIVAPCVHVLTGGHTGAPRRPVRSTARDSPGPRGAASGGPGRARRPVGGPVRRASS